MNRLSKYLTALVALVAVLAVPTAVAAQTEAGGSEFALEGLEAGLVGLFPLVIMVSSLLLKPEANENLKKLLPLVVSLIVSVVYFIAESWPGFGRELVVNIGLLSALAMKTYDPISAALKLVTAGRGLTDLTGPGIVGAASDVEGD